MLSTSQKTYTESAIGNIQDAIAGTREIKAALGMTEESHMEKDLNAAIRRLEKVLEEVD